LGCLSKGNIKLLSRFGIQKLKIILNFDLNYLKAMIIDWRSHITSDPKIMFGKPVIKNTRIPVDLILEKLAAGDKTEDLLEAYPSLSKEDIISCLLFASETIRNEVVYSKAS